MSCAGAKSPHDGRGAHPALLPLDLSDGDFDVSLLAKLSCSECSNVSDALQPNVTASRRAARTDVSISALALRVFLQGWEPAIECINTYQTFAVRAREHLQRSVKADAADALGSTAAPIAAATPAPTATLPPPVHPPTVHISLRLRDISLEAVAAAGGLPSSAAAAGGEETQVLVPAGCLTFRMESTWAIGASGTRASVMFPGALVSVGCVAAGDVMDTVCMDSRDALFGVRGLQLTASSRPVKEAEQQNTVQKVLRLDVGVQHMSCWANQHNLACMAALVQHVSMVAEHASQLQTVPASAKPATEKASSASLGATAYELTAGVDTLAMLLHSARHSGGPSTCPLFELAVMNLAVAASAHGDGAASANASLMLEVDVYNLRKAAWEPCMDPWTLGLHVSFPMAQGSSSARLSTVQHTRLEVRSAEALELTVTAAVADAAAAANSLLQHVSTVASEPDTLHQHVQEGGGAAGVNAALSATYQLRNLSGAALEVWLAAPQQDGSVPLRPPIGPPELVVDSSTSAALPVLLLHSSESLGRRSGRPSSAVGVIPEDDIDDEVQGVWQEKRQRRTLLFFRFAGQGPLAGPVNLDRWAP